MSSQQQQNRETDAEEVEEELDFDNFLQELEHELLPVEEKLPRDFTSDEEKAVVKMLPLNLHSIFIWWLIIKARANL